MIITYDPKHNAGLPANRPSLPLIWTGCEKAGTEKMITGEEIPCTCTVLNGAEAVLQQITIPGRETLHIWNYWLHCGAEQEIHARVAMQNDHRILMAVLLKGKVKARVFPFNTISLEAPCYFPLYIPGGPAHEVQCTGETHALLLEIGSELLDDLAGSREALRNLKECRDRKSPHGLALYPMPLRGEAGRLLQQGLHHQALTPLNFKIHCQHLTYNLLQAYLNDILKPGRGIEAHIEDILLFSRTAHHILDNAGKELSLDHLAGYFSRTPKQLQTLFRKKAGTTVIDFVRRLQVHQAGYLLLTQQQMTLKQVCKACGFKNYYTFWYAFKRKTGITPLKFRKLNTLR